MIKRYIGNCIRFDLNEIYRLIQLYWRETGKIPNYLVMSEKTNELIKDEYNKIFSEVFKRLNDSEFYEYCSVRIAVCNKLEIGEIECI